MEATLIDFMGSDLTVVDAARVSFSKNSEFAASDYRVPKKHEEHKLIGKYYRYVEHQKDYAKEDEILTFEDFKLIGYLGTHNHWTPFGHPTLRFHVKAPIFVARQLVKHQVGLVWNEVSRRYVDDEPEFWWPKEWRGRPAGSIKQGSDGIIDLEKLGGEAGFSPANGKATVEAAVQETVRCYEKLLAAGVAPEMARMILPQNMYTEWHWQGSFAAFARVCNQRIDSHAQHETRELVKEMYKAMSVVFPACTEFMVYNKPDEE